MKKLIVFIMLYAFSSFTMFDYEPCSYPTNIQKIIDFMGEGYVLCCADNKPIIMCYESGAWKEILSINIPNGIVLINNAKNQIMIVASEYVYRYEWSNQKLELLGKYTLEKACRDAVVWDEINDCLYAINGSNLEHLVFQDDGQIISKTITQFHDNHYFSDQKVQLVFNVRRSWLLIAVPNYQQTQLIIYNTKTELEIFNKTYEESLGHAFWYPKGRHLIFGLGQSLRELIFDKAYNAKEQVIEQRESKGRIILAMHPGRESFLALRNGDVSRFSVRDLAWQFDGIVIGDSLQPEGAILLPGQKMLRRISSLCFDDAGQTLLIIGREPNEMSVMNQMQMFRYDGGRISLVKRYEKTSGEHR